MSNQSTGKKPWEAGRRFGVEGTVEANVGMDTQDLASKEADGEDEPVAPTTVDADASDTADTGGVEEAVGPDDSETGTDNAAGSDHAHETAGAETGVSTRKGKLTKSPAQEVAESERARIVRAQQREAKTEAQYELSKKRFIQKVHETRDAVTKLREQCRRDGKSEEDFEDEAKKIIHARAEEFDHSDRMQVMENLLKNVHMPNAETAKRKFEFLVGLGMRDAMKFWSRENYAHRFEKKAGKKIEAVLEQERQQLESEYDEMDRALAELERESGAEEEHLQTAA